MQRENDALIKALLKDKEREMLERINEKIRSAVRKTRKEEMQKFEVKLMLALQQLKDYYSVNIYSLHFVHYYLI